MGENSHAGTWVDQEQKERSWHVHVRKPLQILTLLYRLVIVSSVVDDVGRRAGVREESRTSIYRSLESSAER